MENSESCRDAQAQRRPSGAAITQQAPCAGAPAPRAPQSHGRMSPAALGAALGWGQHCHCCHTQPSPWHQLGLLPFGGTALTLPGHRDHGHSDHGQVDHGHSDHEQGDHRHSDHKQGDHRHNDHGQGDHGHSDHGKGDHRPGDHGAEHLGSGSAEPAPILPSWKGVAPQIPHSGQGNNEEGTTFLFERPFYTVPNKNSSNNHRRAQHGPSGKENAFL